MVKSFTRAVTFPQFYPVLAFQQTFFMRHRHTFPLIDDVFRVEVGSFFEASHHHEICASRKCNESLGYHCRQHQERVYIHCAIVIVDCRLSRRCRSGKNTIYNKKAELSQRWPRAAVIFSSYIWVPWKFSGAPDYAHGYFFRKKCPIFFYPGGKKEPLGILYARVSPS